MLAYAGSSLSHNQSQRDCMSFSMEWSERESMERPLLTSSVGGTLLRQRVNVGATRTVARRVVLATVSTGARRRRRRRRRTATNGTVSMTAAGDTALRNGSGRIDQRLKEQPDFVHDAPKDVRNYRQAPRGALLLDSAIRINIWHSRIQFLLANWCTLNNNYSSETFHHCFFS